MKQPRDARQVITIKMPYIPGLSVNHYKFSGGKYTRPEVKQWKDCLRGEVEWNSPEMSAPKIIVSAEFQNKRSTPDLHNLLKVICDAIAPALGVNDRDIRTETDIPRVVKRDYGIFFGKVNLKCTGEITIEIRELI